MNYISSFFWQAPQTKNESHRFVDQITEEARVIDNTPQERQIGETEELFRELYQEHYVQNIKQLHDQIMSYLESMDLKKQMINCLENGFIGFKLTDNSLSCAFGNHERGLIKTLFEQKLEKANLKGLMFMYEFTVYLDVKRIDPTVEKRGVRFMIDQPFSLNI